MKPLPDFSTDATLTPQQHRIIALLAQGNSITQAAELENIHRNTIANWRRAIPAFAGELESALRDQREFWQEQVTRLAPLAMQAIEDCLTNPNSSPSLRFRAATYILKMATAPKEQLASFVPRLADAQMPKDAHRPTGIEELGSFVPRESEPSAAEEPAQRCTKPQPIRVTPRPGRNEPCSCGSRIKYKRCCANKPGSPKLAEAA